MDGSYIGRWIAFLAAPLITLVSGFVALKANAWFGLNLNSAEVAAYVGGVVLSIGTALGVWLHNRGKYEIASLAHTDPATIEAIEKLLEAKGPTPPASPGGRAAPKGV